MNNATPPPTPDRRVKKLSHNQEFGIDQHLRQNSAKPVQFSSTSKDIFIHFISVSRSVVLSIVAYMPLRFSVCL